MKLRILLVGLTLLFVSLGVAAKDIITTTNGKNIDAKVEEITETVIKYRKASNPNGPLYTIAISSVATIKYENGDIDKFSGSATTPSTASDSKTRMRQSQNGTMTDDELIRQAGNMDNSTNRNNKQEVSDADLLKMNAKYTYNYLNFNEDIQKDVKKAQLYRKVGWIGGGVLAVAGIGVGLGLALEWGWDDCDLPAEIGPMVGGVVAGTAWCLGFNLKANSLMKRAKDSGYYSATIFESEILRNGDKSLMAGINIMGNSISNDKCCGISLKFNF